MEQWINTPFALRLKVFLILLMGNGRLLAAAIVFFVSHDWLLLILSGIIFGCCLFRSTDLLIVILRGDYETITGICTAVTSQPFRRYHKLEPDGGYRFYFRKASRPSLGNEYLDASLSTDLFLGYDSALPGNQPETKNQDTAE